MLNQELRLNANVKQAASKVQQSTNVAIGASNNSNGHGGRSASCGDSNSGHGGKGKGRDHGKLFYQLCRTPGHTAPFCFKRFDRSF